MTRSAMGISTWLVVLSTWHAIDAAPAWAADPVSAPGRIVARQDCEVNPKFAPPVILKRQFWNMLGDGSVSKPMEKHIAQEPMLREAARCHYLPDLRADGNDPLAVSMDRVLKMKPSPDPEIPFVVYTSAGRPPFRCMDDFHPNVQAYQKWKETHPNFLGFWAGVEWDNEYVGPLTSGPRAVDFARKHHVPETAIARMQTVLAQARTDRDAAVQGLRECHLAIRRYYFDDPDKLIMFRAGWCLDHYPLDWGAGMVVLETTNTGPYRHQVSMFHIRGAGRQYGKPWTWYIATYYNGYEKSGTRSVNNEPNYMKPHKSTAAGAEEDSGPGYGMSVSLNRRDMYLAYFGGASLVAHEDWPRAYCQFKDGDSKEWVLSPHGEAMKEWYGFTQRHRERGVSYAPVALLLPFNHGQPNWGGNPWSHFKPERGDRMIDAMMYTLVPWSQDVAKGKEGCLSNGEFGDLYDVLVPNPTSGPISLAALASYPVAVLAGKFDLDAPVAQRLVEYVQQGGTLVVNARQVGERFSKEFLGVKRSGKSQAIEGNITSLATQESISLPEPYDYEPVELAGAKTLWTDGKGGILASVSSVGRGKVVLTTADYLVPRKDASIMATSKKLPLVAALMRQVVKEVLPVGVQGDIEYGLNRVSDGWWVYLINNKGVTKFTKTPDELNPAETAHVTIDLRALGATSACELREDKPVAIDSVKNAISIDVGPGDIRVVKIVAKN